METRKLPNVTIIGKMNLETRKITYYGLFKFPFYRKIHTKYIIHLKNVINRFKNHNH